MSITLTQAEANHLIAMHKQRSDDIPRQFPGPGERLVVPLISMDRTEDFLLDITRSRIDFVKVTYQNRGRQVIVLMRLDVNGPPHRNPDGALVLCPHMHVYREGYGDKWAQPIAIERFADLGNLSQTLSDFMNECNVIEHPIIQASLF